MLSTEPRIIIALDFPERQSMLAFVQQLNPQLCRLKIGSILFTRYGPDLIHELMELGFEIFLDLKFHDIPHTVAGACRVAAELGVWMLTIHTMGGEAMMHAARDAVNQYSTGRKPLIVGVSVLTSLDSRDLTAISMTDSLADLVMRLAQLAVRCGLDGIVCSGQEASLLRQQVPAHFLLVTPGIRLETDSTADQKRAMIPAAAIASGADYLVIGRSITAAKDPLATLENLLNLEK